MSNKRDDTSGSLGRTLGSYVILLAISSTPLLLYYIPATKEVLTTLIPIFDISIGSVRIKLALDMHLLPSLMATVIGAAGGFVMWCYYTRTPCLEDQIPGSVLLGREA